MTAISAGEAYCVIQGTGRRMPSNLLGTGCTAVIPVDGPSEEDAAAALGKGDPDAPRLVYQRGLRAAARQSGQCRGQCRKQRVTNRDCLHP